MKKEALRVTSTVPVAPTTLYFAWIDSDHHSAMTGASAKIDPTVGAKYSACNGYVTGKLVILDLGRRIVMSWRTSDFPRDAADSRVEVHFETLGSSTRLLILHTEIPEGQSEKYKALWNDTYVGPMRAYFSKFLPDPRNPPIRRPPPPPIENEEEEPEETPKRPLREAKETVKAAPAPTPPAKVVPTEGKTEARTKAAKAPATKPTAAEPAVKKAAPKKAEPKEAAPKKKPASKKPESKKKPASKKPEPKKKPAPKKPEPKKALPKKKPASSKPTKKPAKKPASKTKSKKKR